MADARDPLNWLLPPAPKPRYSGGLPFLKAVAVQAIRRSGACLGRAHAAQPTAVHQYHTLAPDTPGQAPSPAPAQTPQLQDPQQNTHTTSDTRVSPGNPGYSEVQHPPALQTGLDIHLGGFYASSAHSTGARTHTVLPSGPGSKCVFYSLFLMTINKCFHYGKES